ncbi:Anaphase-promoting complex subunit 13 [Fukomys damarensis]|uniref:Anaphase-promoting complex subunit 13 n=1 Tax=Fukomys damarensis TaxID=885580 RepID=A0A091DKV4_FUKDA|nr:Anaphase-promoting complex subunit 13 [Fukomys damarensis]
MDSEVQRDGRILDLIDDAWREDKLPYEDVAIPLALIVPTKKAASGCLALTSATKTLYSLASPSSAHTEAGGVYEPSDSQEPKEKAKETVRAATEAKDLANKAATKQQQQQQQFV